MGTHRRRVSAHNGTVDGLYLQMTDLFVNHNPLVSIIIPAYNAAHWIGETLESILAQPNPDTYEVIVVDDGSTDGTQELIQRVYADRVRYQYQPNRGRGAARNAGLKLARGKFTQFFDADDIMETDALRPRLDFLCANPQYAAAYGHAVLFWDGNSRETFEANKRQYYGSGDLLRTEIHNPFLLPIMVLFRKEWAERAGGMDEMLKSNEDWHFWLKLCAMGAHFAFVDGTPVARYRARRNNPPSSAAVHMLSGIQALTQIKPLALNRKDYKSLGLNQAIARWRYGYGYALLKERRRREGWSQILRSLRYSQRGLPAILLQMTLSLLVAHDQIEPTFFRLHALLKHGKLG
jgi:glycosyltransferase involved in cell wall biosynthesis